MVARARNTADDTSARPREVPRHRVLLAGIGALGDTRDMADWSLLRSALGRVDESVRYTWDELDALVGGLPASATKHRAWWSGDRPHGNAWRLAGFTVVNLVPGREVTFVRSRPRSEPGTASATMVGAAAAHVGTVKEPTLLLVTCVKEKLSVPAAARDLYVSPLFKKERAYAERSGQPWYILSAEHGLVAPDEWLAPYERYLPDTPSTFRQAWAMWVVERLDLLAGPLRTKVIEIHAGSAYVDPLRGHLAAKGASILEPLAGLTMGQRLAWYNQAPPDAKERASAPGSVTAHGSTDEFCRQLTDSDAALTPEEFLDRGVVGLNVPGLYSWWVDAAGAHDLSAGLGQPLDSGLIYAGLAGATRWPSGRPSSNTLWSRISGMHLGGRHEFSTFRRTLGSILARARGEPTIDEAGLTGWMSAHLKGVAVPFEDADTLGHLEEDVLRRLDPPLNLKGMAKSPIRSRLKDLRKPHARRKRRAT